MTITSRLVNFFVISAPGRRIHHWKDPVVGIPLGAGAFVFRLHLHWRIPVAMTRYGFDRWMSLKGSPVLAFVAFHRSWFD